MITLHVFDCWAPSHGAPPVRTDPSAKDLLPLYSLQLLLDFPKAILFVVFALPRIPSFPCPWRQSRSKQCSYL